MPADGRGHQVAQARAIQQFHDDEVDARLVADVVDGLDAGMVQRRRRFGFLPEATQTIAIAGEIGGQDLDRDPANETRLACGIALAPCRRPPSGPAIS